MPARRELVLLQNNTETVRLTITEADTGDPQDLTATTVEVYVKPNAETDDTADTVTLLTSAGASPAITVESPASGGVAVLTVPADLTAAAGELWWRADVLFNNARKTALYGPFVVRDT